ncbi:DUF3012 domain-containing protein [Methylophaga sp.]|jgi:hypothetical protein|uniref:DUF3012 domain-containing protein n=1 Tax=Methylophaga sp. TaxID=2024840 RepID=UPI001401BB1E|nr:DUF3012 domain-containing protein [Methylophaga sp.]MTI62962.1 DUF3012 domain-containing protein [Methylophaga sp.]
MLNSRFLSLSAIGLTSLLLSACSPEVGSDKWCQNMEAKPKGDWTANEATDYAKHCLFKTDES